MEKWVIPGLGHGKYKTSLEHSVVPESKDKALEWGEQGGKWYVKRAQRPT